MSDDLKYQRGMIQIPVSVADDLTSEDLEKRQAAHDALDGALWKCRMDMVALSQDARDRKAAP